MRDIHETTLGDERIMSTSTTRVSCNCVHVSSCCRVALFVTRLLTQVGRVTLGTKSIHSVNKHIV